MIYVVVGISIILFLGTFYLNRITKGPEIDEADLPEKCLGCQTTSCRMKTGNIYDPNQGGDTCERS